MKDPEPDNSSETIKQRKERMHNIELKLHLKGELTNFDKIK